MIDRTINKKKNILAELTKISIDYRIPFREVLSKADSVSNISSLSSTNILEELRNYYGRQQSRR